MTVDRVLEQGQKKSLGVVSEDGKEELIVGKILTLNAEFT